MSASLFGRDLQAAEHHGGGFRHPAKTGRDGRAAQRLFPGPEGFRGGAGAQQDDPFERDAPSGQGGGIKLPLAINDNKNRAVASAKGLRSRKQCEGQASAGGFGEPFGKAAAGKSALREELIERENAARTGSFGGPTAGASALQLVGQGRQGG
jgi:hypothetical protein